MTIPTPEELEAIRREWEGVAGEFGLKHFALTRVPSLLSALDAMKERAEKAEARADDMWTKWQDTFVERNKFERAAIRQEKRYSHELLLRQNAESELTALRARVERLEGALTKITRHPVAATTVGRPSLGVEAFPSCQEIARAALKEKEHPHE